MGLFDFIKGQLVEVIEWVDDSRDTLVWKFPDKDKEIKMGAQLTVRESQVAVFINEGVLADVFQPGRHELITRNMPLLSTLKAWKHGFNSPFKADVYFVNTRQFTQQKWGTKQPIIVRDPEFETVRIRSFGDFAFRIHDAGVFFKEFAGTDSHLTTDEIIEMFRTALITKFNAAIAKSGLSVLDMAANALTVGDTLLPIIAADFTGMGITITKFNIESITLPEELQKELDNMSSANMQIRTKRKEKMLDNEMELQNMMNKVNLSQNVQDVNKFLQFQTGMGMEKTGDNPSSDMMKTMLQMNLAQQMMQNQQNLVNNPNNPTSNNTPPPAKESRETIMATLKELGELKAAGILTEDEFNEKKKELLSKL